MSGSSEPSQAQETHGEPGLNSSRKIGLTAIIERYALMRNKLSEDKPGSKDTIGGIVRESTFRNGVPATAIGLGLLRLIRTALPAKFGPAQYSVMGLGFFTAATVTGSFRRFNERIVPMHARPLIEALQPSKADPRTNYATQHDHNRGGADWEGLDPENPPVSVAAEERAKVDRVENSPVELKLSLEQIQYLLSRMSSDERKQFKEKIRYCELKIDVSYAAVPFSFIGVTYIMLNRIPRHYWLCVAFWNNFTALLGVYVVLEGSTNICNRRIQQNALASLWQKYGGDMPVAGMSNLHNSSREDAITDAKSAPLTTEEQAKLHQSRDGPEMTSPVEKENKPVSAKRLGRMYSDIYDAIWGGSSEPSPEQEPNGEPGFNSSRKIRLTSEQIAFVMNKCSDEEQEELREVFGKIYFESIVRNGVPATVIGLGSLYLARTHLPAKFRFGYVGFGVFVIASLLGYDRRYNERMVPIYARLLEKYSSAEPGTNYATLLKLREKVDRVDNIPSALKMSREQIQYLFSKMSSDEWNQLQYDIEECTSNILYQCGVVFTIPAAASAFVHYRERVLKVPYTPWHTGVLLGSVGLMGLALYINSQSEKVCNRRIQLQAFPSLWQKYGGDMPAAGMSNLHNSSGGDAETTGFVPKNTTSLRLWSRIKSFVRPGSALSLDWKQIQFLLTKASWDERKDIDRAVNMANAMGLLVGCLSSSALYWDYRKRRILTWSKGYQFVASFFGVIISGICARHMCGKSLIRPKITHLQEKYGDASVANRNLEKNVTVEPISVVDKKSMLVASEKRTNVVDAHTQSQQPATKTILTRSEVLQPIPDAKPAPLTTEEQAKLHHSREGAEVASPVEKENKPVSAERRGKMHANMYEMYATRGAPQVPFDYPYAVMAGTPLTRERQERRGIKKNPADDEAAS